MILLALVGCGDWREGGGTAIGNPSLTAVRLAQPVDDPWVEATASWVQMSLTPCDGGRKTRIRQRDPDLLKGAPWVVPAGDWCVLALELSRIEASRVQTEQLDTVSLELSVDGLDFEGSNFVLELGEAGNLQSIGSSSGLYLELDANGQLDSLERSQGAAAAAPSRTEDDGEPDVLMIGGNLQFLSPEFAVPGAYASGGVDGLAIVDVVYGNDTWVAVGSYSGVVSLASTDHGQTWVAGNLGSSVRRVHFHNGQFLAPSNNGTIWVSTDGVDWTQTHSTAVSLAAAASSPERTVIVGREMVLHSQDHETWSRIPLPEGTWFLDVTWSPKGFVGVGRSGTIWHSPEGLTWTETTPGKTLLQDVEWTGSRFVAVGNEESWHSPDGYSWTRGPSTWLAAMAVHNGDAYAVGGDRIFRSTDEGTTWSVWRTIDVDWLSAVGSNTAPQEINNEP